jgi:hypothetical protein
MGVWQGVAMDSLKFRSGPPCPILLRPTGGPPLKWPYGRFKGGPSQGVRHAAVFYPIGDPTPYASGEETETEAKSHEARQAAWRGQVDSLLRHESWATKRTKVYYGHSIC